MPVLSGFKGLTCENESAFFIENSPLKLTYPFQGMQKINSVHFQDFIIKEAPRFNTLFCRSFFYV